jgi:hypothetical protein
MKRKEHIALTKCFYCNKDDVILLATRYQQDGQPVHDLSPAHGKVINMDPCSKCADLMKQGVILITIDNEKSGKDWHKPDGSKNWMPNPYRTGGWFVVRDEAIRRMIKQVELANWAIKNRFMFIEHEVADKVGLFAQAGANQ